MPSIGQILSVSFDTAKREINNNQPFHSRQLLEFIREGRIQIRPFTRADTNIVQVAAPLAWTKEDELRTNRENDRINLVAALIENGIDLLEFLIEEKVRENPKYRLVFNPTGYYLGPVMEVTGSPVQHAVIHCAIHVERI